MNNSSNDDTDLFREAMQSVTPLKQTARVNLRTPINDDRLEKRQAALQETISETQLSDHIDKQINPEEALYYARPGLQHQQLKKLKQGFIPWEAALDLHGYQSNTARKALSQFIHHCQHRNLRCIRIVHGKGQHRQSETANLKSLTYHWLQQLPAVMGFSSCLPKDGGNGAVYVLLKRCSENKTQDK